MPTASGSDRRKRGGRYATRILVAVVCCAHITTTAYLWHQLTGTQRMAVVLEQQQRTDAALLYTLVEFVTQHVADTQ